jgi:phosphoenolpyruvate carboxykinase (GTP)
LFGLSPSYSDINWSGLEFTPAQFDSVMDINKADWQAELRLHDELFTTLANGLPNELVAVKKQLQAALA